MGVARYAPQIVAANFSFFSISVLRDARAEETAAKRRLLHATGEAVLSMPAAAYGTKATMYERKCARLIAATLRSIDVAGDNGTLSFDKAV